MAFHYATLTVIAFNLAYLSCLFALAHPPVVLLLAALSLLGTVVLIELECRERQQASEVSSELRETIEMLVKLIYLYGIFSLMAVYQFYLQLKTREELMVSYERYLFVLSMDSQAQNAFLTVLFYGLNFLLGVAEVAILKKKADRLSTIRGNVLRVIQLRSETAEYNKDQCSICCDLIKMSERFLRLHCDHEFHYHCVKRWILKASNCPLCRKAIKQE